MMLALEDFIFEIGTLPYQQLQRATAWKFAKSERFGARDAVQFVGPGDDKITLTGALYPGFAGTFSSIEQIRTMGSKGLSYTLISGTGDVMGQWIILSFNENRSEFLIDGVPRKADFTLELERVDD
ncbi:hypothetical protein MMA231_02500 [Asticcacaulis sp. MM231]|uniref:phage tail protein n=1 Tax=Asticcacaulis sp. MM231 TaxID=3157666 RepID=UPI0032D59933